MFTLRDLKLRLADGDDISVVLTDASNAAALFTEASQAYHAAKAEAAANPSAEANEAVRAAGRLMADINTRKVTLDAEAAELAEFDAISTPEATIDPEGDDADEGDSGDAAGEDGDAAARTREPIAASMKQVDISSTPPAAMTRKPRSRYARVAANLTGDLETAAGDTLDAEGAAKRLGGIVSRLSGGQSPMIPFLRQAAFGSDLPRVDAAHSSADDVEAMFARYDDFEAEAVERHGTLTAARQAAGFGCLAPEHDNTIDTCFTMGSPVFDHVRKVPADNCAFSYYKALPLGAEQPTDLVEWTAAMDADCNGGAGLECEVFDCDTLTKVDVELDRFGRCFSYNDSLEKCSPALLMSHEKNNSTRFERRLEQWVLGKYAQAAEAASNVFEVGTAGAPVQGGVVAFADIMATIVEGTGAWEGRNSDASYDLILPANVRRRLNLDEAGVGSRQPISGYAASVLGETGVGSIVQALDDPKAPIVAGPTFPKLVGGTIAAPVPLNAKNALSFWAVLVPDTFRLMWDGITDWGVDRLTGASCFKVRHQYSTWMKMINRGCYDPIWVKVNLCFNHERPGTYDVACIAAAV